MARRRKAIKISPQIIKLVVIIAIIIGVLFGVGVGLRHLFINAKLFHVKAVVVDPSLDFISKRDYNNFIGKNIFTIDLKKYQKRLSYKYPQIDGLKIVRRFPDRIHLVAKQRLPFAQMEYGEKVFIVDDRGVVLSTTSKQNNKLPSIVGAQLDMDNILLGRVISNRRIKVSLQIIGKFKSAKTLALYKIVEINVSNLSKITMSLSNDLLIILGYDDVGYKMSVLNLLISQNKFNSKNTKYIDLRFKEPVIGKKY